MPFRRRAGRSYASRQAFRRSLVFAGLWALLIFLVISLGAAAGVFAGFLRDLPSLDGLEEYQPSIATTLYTDQDEPFASFYEQRRILLPLSKIPAHLKQAVLAVEDSRFYEHRGLSPRAIARAMIMNLLTRRKSQGGSTITQQLARALFLTPEKSFARKLKEALLAVEIEKKYPKDKILELYFNQVYFGHGAYGVEAAAQTYFKKSVGELTLAEAAMLAGLPSAPNRFSPIVDPARARRRRDHVLNRMVEQKIIARVQAEAASRTPFDETLFTRSRTIAPYFVEHVRQSLEETYGAYALYNSGLKVYTTLNLKMQRAAEEALVGGLRDLDKARGYRPRPERATEVPRVRIGPYTPRPGEILPGTVLKVKAKSLEVLLGRYRGEVPLESMKWTKIANFAEAFREGDSVLVQVLSVDERRKVADLALEQDPELEGALAALDPRDGAIKAMIGGYDFERSKFNRAVQARRQPGSAFKPFVYATAFDRGLTPSTIIEDSPISFHFRVGGKVVAWSPENYDRKFHGPTTLRRGLENSVNVVTVKLIEQVGVDPVIRMAHQMGIESELRREIALALGVSEVTPLELVSAYGVLANGGVRAEPFAIRKVTDSQGRILEEHVAEPQEVIRPETAYVLVNVMKGVVERGTAARARVLKRPLAGKTGTTSEATDVWFIGFTPNLVAGVWVGYDVKKSLGPAETGGRLALPLWITFMQKILPDFPPEDFTPPENVVAIPVNHMTGRPVPQDEKGGILEYFIKGTEPVVSQATSGTPPRAAATGPPVTGAPSRTAPSAVETSPGGGAPQPSATPAGPPPRPPRAAEAPPPSGRSPAPPSKPTNPVAPLPPQAGQR
ncbi:MAG: penicillin-binding protein 1A [candidate division NC10 bacterium RIFCSPLOWO2_12_FULL_66_18]|nr:MAG: penicillin-binding protein 1A [candidate division NC10 bacterium RIFCSPLOWO2_02_FULL_66_22]OGC01101.1 MAG: penicillin-binding protein 1A [candidate division NC10 bacterium RIFCSPLOWO2_12_FULL_66_18]